MALAEVSWSDQSGATHGVFARIEDTSHSGACIRVKAQIKVGSRLRIKWHKEQFSGITRYCCRDGEEYLLGVQRDASDDRVITLRAWNASNDAQTAPPVPTQGLSVRPKAAPQQIGTEAPIEAIPKSATAGPPAGTPLINIPEATERGADSQVAPRATETLMPEIAPRSVPETQETSQRHERSDMLNKLLHLASARHEQAAPNGSARGAHAPVNTQHGEPAIPAKPTGDTSEKSLAPSQGDLLPLEFIYRAAGIINSQSGYNINTVVEMLKSDHLRGMSSDVKRASVLVALESAGIRVDQVLEDAAQRLEAINLFETGQQKHLEDFEARKAEESAQIQAEIERVTTHCLERIKRNLGEVASAKEALRKWQSMKEKEAQRISEAVTLFAKQPASEAPSKSQPALQAAGVAGKP